MENNTVKSESQLLVSVGIPAYNRPEGLKRTLECITGQTYKNLEIIVSDNCSPDPKVEEVVKEFKKHDNRIQYFRQDENIGSTNNFKYVLEKATGEYFMWAADDDEWENFYVEKILKEFQSVGNNFVAINFEAQYVENNFKKFEYFAEGKAFYYFYSSSVKSRLKHLLKFNYGNLVYSIYRMNVLEKINNMIWVKNEIPFMLQIMQYGNWKVIPEVGFYKKTNHNTYMQTKWENYGGKLPKTFISLKNALKSFVINNLGSLRYHWTAFYNIKYAINSVNLSFLYKTNLIIFSKWLLFVHFLSLLIGYKSPKFKKRELNKCH